MRPCASGTRLKTVTLVFFCFGVLFYLFDFDKQKRVFKGVTSELKSLKNHTTIAEVAAGNEHSAANGTVHEVKILKNQTTVGEKHEGTDLPIVQNAKTEDETITKEHLVTYGTDHLFSFSIPEIVHGANDFQVEIHVTNSRNETLDGEIFSLFAIGDDGGLFKASLVPRLNGIYHASFAAFSFLPGPYTLELRAEQFLDGNVSNQSMSLPAVLATKEAAIWIESRLSNDIDFDRRSHVPVCDPGTGTVFVGGHGYGGISPPNLQTVTRTEPRFRVDYQEESRPLSGLGTCGPEDFTSSQNPGSFFNSSECSQQLPEHCCSNGISGWDRMYRLHSCCLRSVSTKELEQLNTTGERVLFAGDSTTHELMKEGHRRWPTVFPQPTSDDLIISGLIDFTRLSDPYRNSLKWVVDEYSTGSGKRFWRLASYATFVVVHACAHEICPPKGKKKNMSRKSPLQEYKRRFGKFVQMMGEKQPGKPVLVLSCGSQTFRNVVVSSQRWSCEKARNCTSGTDSQIQRACHNSDLENLSWALDSIAKEIVSKSEQFFFLDLHSAMDVARADLNLYPQLETSANLPHGEKLLTGDIHVIKGRGHPRYPGWLCTLKTHMVMGMVLDMMKMNRMNGSNS